jgi:DNA-binding winged helix-turn-helix (wHTH) protein
MSARTVCEIRAAIGDDKRQMVRVISGRGYLFQAEVTEVPASSPARGL